MNLGQLFFFNVKASLTSTGGLGNVPSLHDDLVAHHLVTENQFVAALAVGQLSPGPNGLWVVALGFAVAGLPGALVCLAAICVPACLVLGLQKIYQKHQDHMAMKGLVWGLSMATVAEFSWTMSNVVRSNGTLWLSALLAAVSCAISMRSKLPVILLIAVAAILGILLKL